MSTTLRQTPLHAWHQAHHGRMVDFAGWSMPVQYDTIVAEHQATRGAAGLFDISHMGRLTFHGPQAGAFLESMATRSVQRLEAGAIRYSLLTNNSGGILDDVLVYRSPSPDWPWMLVVNAGNRDKIVRWLNDHGAQDDDVGMRDRTESTGMIALQGPRALAVLREISDADASELKYYSGGPATVAGRPCYLSRTGYTGEDGCELVLAAEDCQVAWEALLKAGQAVGVLPAGLGARDTLRLEAAMPLYGHELNEQIHPFQAGLGFAVQLTGRDFPGAPALRQAKFEPCPKLIGLALSGRRVPRESYSVLANGRRVGEVTSGTFSPTLQQPIAMAYVEPLTAGPWTVDIRGQAEPAAETPLPFYKRGGD